MALRIDDSETEHLARRLAQLKGETIEMATKRAIAERLCRLGNQPHRSALLDDLTDIRRRWAKLQIIDDRTEDEILGYDEHGLPS